YPIEGEADQTEVRGLLFRLEDLKAQGIVDPGPEPDSLPQTLTNTKVKIVIHTTDGDQTVKLYQPDETSGTAIAETSADGPLYRIPSTTIKDVTNALCKVQDNS